MRWLAKIAICALLWSASAAVSAAELTWSLSAATFADGGSLSGTFVLNPPYRAPTTTWNVSVAGGGSSFPAHSYTPATSTALGLQFVGTTEPTIILKDQTGTRQVRLTPASALDGSLASVPLTFANNNGRVECFNCSPFRYITAGSLLLTSAKPAVALVSLAPDPSIVGATVTATVLVETLAAFGSPTGTVTVLDEGNNTVCTILLPNTSCSFNAPSPPGGKTLHAQYGGDVNYASASSNSLSYTVLPAVTTTVTLVSVTPDPTTVGATTTATATVATVDPLGAPTGKVEVLDGNNNSLCTITLPAPSCTFLPATAGAITVVAQYSGDATYASGLSNVLPLTVGPVATVATLVSVAPNPTVVDTTTTATVSIETVAPFGAPTGTVTVLDNLGSPLCTITLPAPSCTFIPATAGDFTVVAIYDGDANYEGAASNELPLTILPLTSVQLQSFEVD